MFCLAPESNALHGNKGTQSESLNNKIYSTAAYLYYGTYKKASIEIGISQSTLNQRVKSLQTMDNEEFKKMAKMSKKDLADIMMLYNLGEKDYDQTDLDFEKPNS
jgi:hypothetical protein